MLRIVFVVNKYYTNSAKGSEIELGIKGDLGRLWKRGRLGLDMWD